ncbi:hypothetical protein L345_06606, partial [Ophiophagus hannah]
MTPTCSVSHCFVRVDALVELPAVEEVLQKLLDLGNAGGASHQHNVVDLGLVQLGIPQSLFHRLQGTPEEVSIQLFKASPGDGGVEVNALIEGVNFNGSLSGGAESALGPLTSGAQPPDGPLVVCNVLLMLALELRHKVVHHAIVKILAAQVSVPGGRFHFKDAILNRQDGHIKGATAQAMAAAVGSLMMRRTLSPAMVPASLVACRWESLK